MFRISIFEETIFIHIVNLIIRIIYLATLGDKMENNLEKADFIL
jgi:hypothetical protein